MADRPGNTLTAGMVICFALAGWHFAGNPASEASVAESTSPVPAVTCELGAADASGPATTSIEEIRLGQRVVGKNPLRHETQSPSNIAPENWRAVQLSMYLGEVRYDLNFLRSLDWLKATDAAPGRTVHMQLPEMGLNGPALVEAIAPCPPIEPDDGTGRQIVTGLMIHRAENILDISITGLEEPLGVTTTHPIWSETRQHFVKAGQLEIGEHLRSTTGHLAEVTHITPHRGPPQNVYNLEVNSEHVYQVGETGLLVHNTCDGLYHYTDAAGLDGILKTGAIRANKKGEVFLTTDVINKDATVNALFAGNPQFAGKGDFLVEIRPRVDLPLEGGVQANELIHRGTLRAGRDFDFIFHGPNLLR